MKPKHRLAAVICAILLVPLAVGAEENPPKTPPKARRSRQPIRDSIDRHVEQVIRAHEKPCERAARLGIPCFPATAETEGPRFSVAEALRRYRPGSGPAPGAPTNDEIREQLTGRSLSASASAGVSVDPVCTAKSLIRAIRGKTTTFHLYRLTSREGERPLLTDRKIDPQHYDQYPGAHYEFLGTYTGECEAITAWRKALREARAKSEEPPAAGDTQVEAEPQPPADDEFGVSDGSN